MALTFGTLLSSQGADAHALRPIFLAFIRDGVSTVHRVPQRSNHGVRPAVSQALRPGAFSLGAGKTIHALRGSCVGGPGSTPGRAENPVRVPGRPGERFDTRRRSRPRLRPSAPT